MARTEKLILSSMDGSGSEEEEEASEAMEEGEGSSEEGTSEDGSSSEDDEQSPQPGTSAVKKKRGLQLPPGYESITAASAGHSSVVSALNAEEVVSSDLWVIRLPHGVKPKHVAGLKLDLSALDTTHLDRPHKVGEIRVAEADYDIFAQQIPTSLPRSSSSSHKQSKEIAPETSEVSLFTPLVPDQNDHTLLTKIVIATQKLSKVIFFRRRLPREGINRGGKKNMNTILSSKCGDVEYTSKREQPEGLELRNIPYGAKRRSLNLSSDSDNDHLHHSSIPFSSQPSKRSRFI